jgi:hypothetical protein
VDWERKRRPSSRDVKRGELGERDRDVEGELCARGWSIDWRGEALRKEAMLWTIPRAWRSKNQNHFQET